MAKQVWDGRYGRHCAWSPCNMLFRETSQELAEAAERQHYYLTHVRPVESWQRDALRDAQRTLRANGREVAPKPARVTHPASGELPALAKRALTTPTKPLPRVRLMRNASTGLITAVVPEAGEWGALVARATIQPGEKANAILADTRRQWNLCRTDKCACTCRCHARWCYAEDDSPFHYRQPWGA